MKKQIAILAGDGIGPEIMEEAIKVLTRVGEVFDHDFVYKEALIGGAAFEKFAEHFPQETVQVCEDSAAILFGSVGGPVSEQDQKKWQGCEVNSILAIRKHFGFNINLRPIKVFDCLPTVLKDDVVKGTDILCVRELSSGIYFGDHQLNEDEASDVMKYSAEEIEKIARVAFSAAQIRAKKKVTSVDKANVLACGKLWRKVVDKVAKDFPKVEYEHILVDNLAMQVMRRPSTFDTLLMPNMFGDIISDELSVLSGSLGMLPSASINEKMFAMYEPSGGSAPDIAGQGIANPIGQILSMGMMLRYSFNMDKEYEAVMRAVDCALRDGYRTKDVALREHTFVSTDVMGDVITNLIKK
jgi:3-isopropylmalate dehydrogenase